jgi:predicted nucleotide-binding protein
VTTSVIPNEPVMSETSAGANDEEEETTTQGGTLGGNSGSVVTTKVEAKPFRVFITHGKNMELVSQVKDVLDLYDIPYEIAVEEETVAIPVPQKVLTGMRKCSAGIMIVSVDEQTDTTKINNNVLIEIGAAFVLYDQKVILLWDKQLKVPSNLQGLYRCEYEGNQLSFAIGTKLAKAVKGFKSSS